MAAKFKMKNTFNFRKFRGVSKKAFDLALQKGAIQLLDWTANGSSKVQEKAPIRWGVLRASGSAFVGSKLVSTTRDQPVKDGTPEPNESYNGNDRTITIGYNAAYAAAMHQGSATYKDARGKVTFNPGKFSQQAGNSNPGNKWLLKHLVGDGELLMTTIGNFLQKGLDNG